MTDARMLIIVPTRSRPENVSRVIKAWEETDAFRHADLLFAYDWDDPKCGPYELAIADAQVVRKLPVHSFSIPEWHPLVPKLNRVAMTYAKQDRYFAIGFAGDDHLPRSVWWAGRYMHELKKLGTGVVSCPDGYRKDQLPTQWAMTADIVRALGRMVPAPVEHLYCDNAVQDLAEAAGCYAYLDDVLIEHMHPAARKAPTDAQYQHVNRTDQFRKDRAIYQAWKAAAPRKMQIEQVRALRSGGTAPNPECGASISGACLEMTEGNGRCPDGECIRATGS